MLNKQTKRLDLYFKGDLLDENDDRNLIDLGIADNDVVYYAYESYKDFINTQHPDGYWTQEITYYADVTNEQVNQAILQNKNLLKHAKNEQEIIYTWIGINILTTQYPELEDQWKLIVRKGKMFLRQFDIEYQELVGFEFLL